MKKLLKDQHDHFLVLSEQNALNQWLQGFDVFELFSDGSEKMLGSEEEISLAYTNGRSCGINKSDSKPETTPKYMEINVWGDTPEDMAAALEELATAIRTEAEDEYSDFESDQLKVTGYGDCN